MSKLKLALLMGGKSPEHEISLASGQNVFATLDRSKYDIKPIIITKTGEWLIKPGYNYSIDEIENLSPVSPAKGLAVLEDSIPDIVFIALHGPYGEDGTIQGALEILGIPYTGPDVIGTAIGIDKIKTHEILAAHGINMPDYITITKHAYEQSPKNVASEIFGKIGLPCVIKPAAQGSSIGVSLATSENELEEGLCECFKFGNLALIEKYIPGDELSCSVLDLPHNDGYRPTALAIAKLIPEKYNFYSFNAKYEPGATKKIMPAPISADLASKINETAVQVHSIVGASPFSRVDTRFDGTHLYVLEINTIPGITKLSIFPKACEIHGIGFSRALDIIIEYGLKRRRNRFK